MYHAGRLAHPHEIIDGLLMSEGNSEYLYSFSYHVPEAHESSSSCEVIPDGHSSETASCRIVVNSTPMRRGRESVESTVQTAFYWPG